MTPKRSDATNLRLMLTVYGLSQQGVYTKEMITFTGDFHCDIELPLCLYQESSGDYKFTLEDRPPAIEIPERPELNDVPRTVFLSGRGILGGLTATAHITNQKGPPILPENPTPEQRWEYLLAVVKHKSVR